MSSASSTRSLYSVSGCLLPPHEWQEAMKKLTSGRYSMMIGPSDPMQVRIRYVDPETAMMTQLRCNAKDMRWHSSVYGTSLEKMDDLWKMLATTEEAFASQTARQVFLEMLRVVWCTRNVKMRHTILGSLRVNRVVDFVKLSAASEGTFTSGEDDETEKKEEQEEENFVHNSAVWSSASQTSKLKWLLRAVLKCDINRLGEYLAKELVGQCQTNLLRTIEEVIQNLGDESKMCESLHPFFGRSEYSGLVCCCENKILILWASKPHASHSLLILSPIISYTLSNIYLRYASKEQKRFV